MTATHHADKSFWLAHAPAENPSPPLTGEEVADVAVIGGGFTGLSTAYHIRKADPSASVAVLEGECVAFGASGRTSGWVVPTPVLDVGLAETLYGRERLDEYQDFAWEGLDYVRDLIAREKMDSDFELPGVTFTSFGGKQKKLEGLLKYWQRLPRGRDTQWLDKRQVNAAFNSTAFDAGIRFDQSGQVNPVKHARELKRIAVEAGARIYEQTPVMNIEEGPEFHLTTPQGLLRARRLVLATNGFTHLLPPELGLQRGQMPMFVYQLMTEPLSDADWKALGWQRRQQFYDKSGYLPPTCRTTVDGRLQFNLCDVYLGMGRSMEESHRMAFYAAAERMFAKMFPAFGQLRIAQRWCGACSLPWDLRPQIGALKGGSLSYAFGYSGAGVMMSQNFGRILADLALGRSTALTDKWWVSEESKPGKAKLRRYPRIPGAYTAMRAAMAHESATGLRRRRRFGLD